MKRNFICLLSFLVVFSFMSISIPNKTYACSCAFQPDSIKALEQAKAVFSGKVLEVKQRIIDVDDTLQYRFAVLFEVNHTWKGISQTQVIINTNIGSSACGNDYKIGQTYLVFANGYDDNGTTLRTSICSLTKEITNSNSELNKIGQGIMPTENVSLKKKMDSLDLMNKMAFVKATFYRLFKNNLVKVLGFVLIILIGFFALKKAAFKPKE